MHLAHAPLSENSKIYKADKNVTQDRSLPVISYILCREQAGRKGEHFLGISM